METSDRPVRDLSPEEEETRAHAMMLAALVLGYNEMAARADTLGDKVFFRLHREACHKLLRELPHNYGYVIEFAEPAPTVEDPAVDFAMPVKESVR